MPTPRAKPNRMSWRRFIAPPVAFGLGERRSWRGHLADDGEEHRGYEDRHSGSLAEGRADDQGGEKEGDEPVEGGAS